MPFFQNLIARFKAASLKQWAVFILMLLNTICTYVGNAALPKSNSQMSEEYTVIITPPGGAFSIWGLIFVTEWIFAVWQLLYAPDWAESKQNLFGFALWVICQSLWAICFPFELIWFCFVVIFINWIGLLLVEIEGMNKVRLLYANKNNKKVLKQLRREQIPTSSNNTSEDDAASCNCFDNIVPAYIRYFAVAVAPQAIHLGWITAATGLNLCIGVAKDNDTLAPSIAACIAVCCLIAVTAWSRCVAGGNVAVAFSLIWALVWIQHRETSHPIRLGDNSTAMMTPVPVRDAFTIIAEILAALIGSLTLGGFIAREVYYHFYPVDSSSSSSANCEGNNNNKKTSSSINDTNNKQVGDGEGSLPEIVVASQNGSEQQQNKQFSLETKLVVSSDQI